MEVQGKIKLIKQTEELGQKGFKKRLLVVTTSEQYPQDIPLDFVQDKVSLLDAFSVGQEVKVGINLRGNEYNGKYYLNAQGWRIEKVGESQAAPFKPAGELVQGVDDDSDGLPF